MKNIFDKKKYPNCHSGYQYILDVVSEKIITNIYIKSLCKKILKDFDNKEFIFDREWAEKFMRLFQKFEHVIAADSWKTKNITLEPWQCFLFMCIEGFYWKRNNKRKYKTLYCEVARGNGKSAMLSVTGLIYLSLYRSVSGNKILALAAKKEQARIVLDSSREMAKKNESYRKHTGTEVYAHHISHDSSGSEFKAISSDSKTGDGLQPLLAIVDELHAHRDRSLYDVIDSAMSKRPDSLMAVITTAGFSLEGIGYSQSSYAKKVSLEEIKDETFFPIIYTLDENDDWRDESVWIKANPNLGVSVDIDAFRSKSFKAKANPADEINFKVKHLNLWQNAASQFFNDKKWKELGNKSLTIDDLRGQKCYVGVDLASHRDLTSIALVFKINNKYKIITRNFCPEKEINESKNVYYKEWEEQGYLIKTPGNAINYDIIEDTLYQLSKIVRIESAHYDHWNAAQFAQKMTEKRINMLDFRMNTSNLSEPMKKLDAIVLESQVEHDGNELVNWSIGNVVAKIDHNQNVFPRKEHESMKIDPIVAIIMALAGWINEENNESIYKDRGMIIL